MTNLTFVTGLDVWYVQTHVEVRRLCAYLFTTAIMCGAADVQLEICLASTPDGDELLAA
jgi:hypothetical protein